MTRAPAVAGDQRRFYQGIAETLLKGAIDDRAALEGVRVMACLEAARLSARTGTSVGLPLTPDEADP
ncbi:hypothetical protein ACRBEV_19405 [Methylobacterium phyllosphaerae]